MLLNKRLGFYLRYEKILDSALLILIKLIFCFKYFSEIAYFYAIFFVFTGVAERSFGQVFRYNVAFRS